LAAWAFDGLQFDGLKHRQQDPGGLRRAGAKRKEICAVSVEKAA